jgi:hypothetical protein
MVVLYLSLGLNVVLLGLILKLTFKSSAKELPPSNCDSSLKELISFLEEADDAYILSNKNKKPTPFCEFATKKVCDSVMHVIRTSEDLIFGDKTNMHRVWSIVWDEGTTVKVKKTINHKAIRLRGGVSISSGDTVQEYWTISKVGNDFIVEDIV